MTDSIEGPKSHAPALAPWVDISPSSRLGLGARAPGRFSQQVSALAHRAVKCCVGNKSQRACALSQHRCTAGPRAAAEDENDRKRGIEIWAKPMNVLSHYNRLERMLHNSFRERKRKKEIPLKTVLERDHFLDQKSLHASEAATARIFRFIESAQGTRL